VPTFWTALDGTEEALSYNPDAEILFLRSTLVSRAFENTCAVVFANAGGKKDKGYAGLSCVVMPLRGIVAEAEGTEEQVVVGEVDIKILEVAEDNYGIRKDLLSPGFHYTWSKI
jgi:predicted amidohydrolase